MESAMTNIIEGTNYALLVYDIPTKMKFNPSMLLRRWGFRINLSCWVLPLKNVALVPMAEWVERGATVEVVEFSEHERTKVVDLARKALYREINGTRTMVDKSVLVVRKRYNAAKSFASGTPEREKAAKFAERLAYTSLYRAKALADAAEECALHFDLTGDVVELLTGLRAAIKAHSALFFNMQQEVAGPLAQQALIAVDVEVNS
jgi:hypothetical protein